MRFAIILAGCGQHDGSETHEVVLTLLSLAQEKIDWDAFAPDIIQAHVTNHLTNQIEEGERRHVLKESARLVRGKIKPIAAANISNYDAIIFPGGVGAVSNLSDWHKAGDDFSFTPAVKSFIDQSIAQKKPMGFVCIAPVMIPKLFKGANLTIGNDSSLVQQMESLGANHINCDATEIVIDENHRIVSTPANMVASGIDEVYEGIHKMVKALAVMV
jgi:enhancing lycopene biosynthesis protein 2